VLARSLTIKPFFLRAEDPADAPHGKMPSLPVPRPFTPDYDCETQEFFHLSLLLHERVRDIRPSPAAPTPAPHDRPSPRAPRPSPHAPGAVAYVRTRRRISIDVSPRLNGKTGSPARISASGFFRARIAGDFQSIPSPLAATAARSHDSPARSGFTRLIRLCRRSNNAGDYAGIFGPAGEPHGHPGPRCLLHLRRQSSSVLQGKINRGRLSSLGLFGIILSWLWTHETYY
jgi:hypothetical protein